MARVMFTDYRCPICGCDVKYPEGYNPKTATNHGNVEWTQTRRGLKQYFHTNCYEDMVHKHEYWMEHVNLKGEVNEGI